VAVLFQSEVLGGGGVWDRYSAFVASIFMAVCAEQPGDDVGPSGGLSWLLCCGVFSALAW